jgi:mannose-6-phosphate isomerase
MASNSSIILQPIKFKPIIKLTPWGGKRLVALKQLDPHMSNIGESWELSAVEGDESVVDGGIFDGYTLTQLIGELKTRLVGKTIYQKFGTYFPLLIKYIDAKSDLSIQVHPNDEVAREYGYNNGKTEMWYIVEAGEGASLLFGLKPGASPELLLNKVNDGTVCEMLKRHPVTNGDCFYIPAGQVHAICSNVFLIEIQQSSDLTYRIFDYNRPGLDGKPRQLHLEQAVKAIDFHTTEHHRQQYEQKPDSMNELVNCPYFVTSLGNYQHPAEIDLSDRDSFTILIAFEGQFTVSLDGNTPTHVVPGETVLLPAESKHATIVSQSPSCRFIEVHMDSSNNN